MFGPNSTFHRVLYDDEVPSPPSDAKQLVLCSGKIYYDLLDEREKRGIKNVHFLRLEQIYPFPHDALAELMEPYKHCDVVWCQEEPRNMGAWPFASTFIEEVAEELGFKSFRPRFAGRKSAGSPATGQFSRHAAEQQALIDDALTIGKKAISRIQTRIAEEKEMKSKKKRMAGK
jgi:2-oxoglutarate dehydrogenase E1 component